MSHTTILAQLFAAYPTVEVTDATVAMYLRLLADIPTNTLQVAVDQCIAESKFLPTVAEIRERAATLTTPHIPPWEEAWAYTLRMVRECGAANKPRITSNPILAQTVETIGWRELCHSDNIAVTRAHFRDVYKSIAQRHTDHNRLLPAAHRLVDSVANYRPKPIAQLVTETLNEH